MRVLYFLYISFLTWKAALIYGQLLSLFHLFFYVNKSRVNQELLSFPRFGPKLWNFFPENLRSFSKRSFNKKIHALYLLNSEDKTSKETIAAKITTEFKEII